MSNIEINATLIFQVNFILQLRLKPRRKYQRKELAAMETRNTVTINVARTTMISCVGVSIRGVLQMNPIRKFVANIQNFHLYFGIGTKILEMELVVKISNLRSFC